MSHRDHPSWSTSPRTIKTRGSRQQLGVRTVAELTLGPSRFSIDVSQRGGEAKAAKSQQPSEAESLTLLAKGPSRSGCNVASPLPHQ